MVSFIFGPVHLNILINLDKRYFTGKYKVLKDTFEFEKANIEIARNRLILVLKFQVKISHS